MKVTNKLNLILVLAGLLALEGSLEAYVKRRNENDDAYPYTPNSLALEQNAQDESDFFETDWNAIETQEKAKKSAADLTLKNKVNHTREEVENLKRQLQMATREVKKIKEEHARLRNNNSEK